MPHFKSRDKEKKKEKRRNPGWFYYYNSSSYYTSSIIPQQTKKNRLSETSSSFLERPLNPKLRLPQLIRRRILNLQLLKRPRKLSLNLVLSSPLELHPNLRRRNRALDLMDVRLKIRLGLVPRAELLVSDLELLSVLDHLLNLSGRETADRVGDGCKKSHVSDQRISWWMAGKRRRTDGSLAARGTVLGRDLQQTVGINLEGGDKLSLATGHGGNTSELEFTEEPVVAALGTFTLVDGEGNSGLVVLNGGEDTRLVGGDGGVAGDDDTEDITLHGDTEGEGGDIEEEEVLGLVRGLAGEDGSLDGGTVGNSLIGVDGLVELAATEELGNERLDLGDTGGSTDEDDVVDLLAGDLGVLQDLVDGVDGGLELGGVDLLETGTGDVGGEVLTLESLISLPAD